MTASRQERNKMDLWVRDRRVVPLPEMELPLRFKSRKFSSYAEFNAWKRDLLVQIAEKGGVRWRS